MPGASNYVFSLLCAHLQIRTCKADIALSRLRLSNCLDDQARCMEDLELEEGELARRVREVSNYRHIAFNGMNVKLNSVMGATTGSFSSCLASKSAALLAYALADGSCLTSSSNVAVGTPDDCGFHTKTISCISYNGNLVVTGSIDGSMRVWDAAGFAVEIVPLPSDSPLAKKSKAVLSKPPLPKAPKSTLLFNGHTAAVTVVHVEPAYVISGGAELCLLLWCPRVGTVFRQLRAFDTSVISLSVSGSTFSCGCTDGLVRVWNLAPSSRNPVGSLRAVIGFKCEDEGAVTSIAHSSLEIVCGHRLGMISCWNMDNGTNTYTVRPHSMAVTAIQVDTQRIVSCAFDGFVKVWCAFETIQSSAIIIMLMCTIR